MNFLAHLYLSGDDSEIIIGNFIADHVKGNASALFTPGIRRGIQLHRAIDTYTDTHPEVLKQILLLRHPFRKYAGVVLDMYYDHFLAKEWSDWCNEPLSDFSSRMYRIVKSSGVSLPAKTQRILPFMEQQDWLSNYGNFEGLHRAFAGLARRTPFVSNMEQATSFLQQHYEIFAAGFEVFFPQLDSFTRQKLWQIQTA